MEIAPNSVYLSEHLENVTEHFYKELRDSANQKQMVASGWIATPETMSLNEAHAARVFEARKRALMDAETAAAGENGAALRTVYRRSRAICDYVLKRAAGNCESCEKPAPFMKTNGSPYLEPHHINRLSDGGLDHPRYIGAICPACHREIHYGLHGRVKNEALKAYVASIEPKS